MSKRLNKAAAIILALIMIATQLLVVFAGNESEPEFTNVYSESEIRKTIRERFDKDIESDEAGELSTQRRIDVTEEKAVDKKQLSLAEAASEDSENSAKSGIVPNQIIVKYKTGTSSMTKSALNSKVSAVSSKPFNKLGITKLELPRGADVHSAVDKLKDDPNVEYAEPVYVRNAFGLTKEDSSSVVDSVYCSDPFYTKGWQWGLESLNMEDMWGDITVEQRSEVTIAVIDTGVDVDHDELKGSIVAGYDFVNNDSNADDDCGHGTHVAGIAAAAHDSKGVAGVAGGSKIMPVKVLDENGSGSTASVINGILYAVNNEADVINLSLGSDSPSRAEEEAVQYALGRGVTVVAAAGNDYGGPVSYPAAYDGVIAVGAVDWDGEAGEFIMADFSNAGTELDILAPGVNILSTIPQELDNLGNRMLNGMGDMDQDGYSIEDGTSMAAPFVAGMAALLLAEEPDWDCASVLTEMKDRGEPFSGITYCEELDEEINVTSDVLNSGLGSKELLNFRRAVLSHTYSDTDETYQFGLSFEDYKDTVTDTVYGTFDLMMREYSYTDGFEWTAGPQVAGEIVIEEGQGSGSADVPITALNKNYAFYINGIDGYIKPNPALIKRDNSNSFSEALEIQLNVEVGAAIDFGSDKDYFKFTVEEEGYYVIESTGGIKTTGYLYDSEENLLASGRYDYRSGNFRIDEDIHHDRLILTPGTYYVKVSAYIIGNYGVIIREPETVSGTVALPSGTASEDIAVEVNLITRTWDSKSESYDYDYKEFNDIVIFVGQSSANFSITAESGIDYVVEYYIENDCADYLPVGYYSTNGTELTYNRAEEVAAGAANVNMTLIPSATVVNDISNIPYAGPTLELGTAMSGAIEYGEDADWYKLTVNDPGYYMVGIGADHEIEDYPRIDNIIDSSGDYVFEQDFVYGYNGSEIYEYITLNLAAGDYWIEVEEDGIFHDAYEYKIIADAVSEISGVVSLPYDRTSVYDEEIDIIAESTHGMCFLYSTYIEEGRNGEGYMLPVPASCGYIVGYNYYGGGYLDQGYYSTSGTKIDKALATPVDASSNIGGINMELVPIPEGTDLDNDVKDKAVQINIDTLVGGRTNGAEDVDYFKFSVPQGGGYYNIETQSEEGTSVYIYDDSDWLLYNEGYESLTNGFFNEGTYYLMIRSYDYYYGDYSFIVKTIHKPTAAGAVISGTARVGSTLTGRYTYSDSDGDKESGSAYRWLRSDAADGTYTAITGATARTYTLTQSDLGKYIKFAVTPKAANEPKTGTSVISGYIGPIQAAASGNPGSGGNGGGGSGGGGGGSVEDSSNNTANEQTGAGSAEVRKEADGTTTVEVKVDSSKLNSALTTAGKTPVTLDVKTTANPDNLEVNIPSDIFSKAAEAQKPVVVNSNNVGFTIEPGTFNAGSLNGEVKLEVSQLAADSIKDIIKNKDAAADEVSLVFDFDLSIDDNKITEFNKPITITVKFDASKVTDLSKVGVYYYNEKSGTWEYVGGKANPDGTITFTVEHFSKYIAMEYKKTFSDIKEHWAKSDIELLISKHIARSESEESFAPNTNITRAAFASMVVKALDIKGVKTDKVFADIPTNAWYSEDVYKAYASGIIGGISSRDFAPDELITREQMAAMLMRAYEYATGKKLEEIVTTMNVRFTDESRISSWARRNVILANATGLIAGNPDGTYNPEGNTTKAQAATVIKRLMQKLNRL